MDEQWRLQLSEGQGDVQMLTGQMRMHKCVFEMSGGGTGMMVGTKGTRVIVNGLVPRVCRCGKCQ